jgi:L-iditol 2-dehydrogenase
VENVPDPAGRAIVEVRAATTCGTDVKMWRHGHRALGPYPCAFGHETAGVLAGTGERVLVSDSVACGRCETCRSGRPQICREPTWVLGGFAERIAAPPEALHPIPEGLSFAAAAMAEPFAAAVHAVSRGTDASDVGILGAGPMGLMLCALLAREGRTVTIADRHAERREQADHLGARGVERLGHHPLVFEAVGRPEAWQAAAAAAGPGGVVVLVGGCPSGMSVELDPAPLHYDELELRGAFHHSRDEVDTALATLLEIDLSTLLGETVGLEELPVALSHTGGRSVKWVVDPRA